MTVSYLKKSRQQVLYRYNTRLVKRKNRCALESNERNVRFLYKQCSNCVTVERYRIDDFAPAHVLEQY